MRCLLFPLKFWLGRLQHILMAYFCWADVVKLWQDLMVIKQCNLTLGKKKKIPQPKQHAAGYAPPPTCHTSALSSNSVRNSSATLQHNNKQHRDKSDWRSQLVSCCRCSMGGWCLMSCCETSKTASKSCLRVCRHGSSGERQNGSHQPDEIVSCKY